MLFRRRAAGVLTGVLAALAGGGCLSGDALENYRYQGPDAGVVTASVAAREPAASAPSEAVAERLRLMEQRVEELAGRMGGGGPTPGLPVRTEEEGRLRDLQRKAVQCDVLALELQDRNRDRQTLAAELDTARATITRQGDELLLLRRQTNELARASAALRAELEPLKDMLRVLRLGRYEYYTIQPNDTCEKIAAQPMIYGDATKSTLIRQMNRGMVADLDHLAAGDVLLIPRLEGSGNHEF